MTGFSVSGPGDTVRPLTPRRADRAELLVGYHITLPPVPACTVCAARYARLDRADPDQPLECRFVCWCGAKLPTTFDDAAELDDYLESADRRRIQT